MSTVRVFAMIVGALSVFTLVTLGFSLVAIAVYR